MGKKIRIATVLLGVLCILFFAVSAIAQCISSSSQEKDFSWYGESGALKAPVHDQEKSGYWWMPDKAPEGQENIQWGNRGYVFVGTKKPVAVETPPPPPPAPKEKVVYVEKPVEKIVYRDRIVEKVVEKPVEKIVYRDRVVEKIVEKVTTESLNIKDVYFTWDSAALTPLALQTLKENANVLKANPAVKVLLVGSASPEGASDYNQKLSERRVASVKNYLVSKEGIASDRLNTEAKGAIPADKPSWPFARKVGFLVAK